MVFYKLSSYSNKAIVAALEEEIIETVLTLIADKEGEGTASKIFFFQMSNNDNNQNRCLLNVMRQLSKQPRASLNLRRHSNLICNILEWV